MKLVLVALALTYLGYAVVMVLLHPRLIYPFQPDDRVLPGFERVALTAADGTTITVQERAGSGPVVLYFMGNAGAVPLFETAFDRHVAADRHIIALEYRGGAGRPGDPSEAVLKADSLVAADHALALGKPLIVQGYSLGTGLAIHVAGDREVSALVLTAPYDRLCRLMASRAWLPACQMPFVQRWDSLGAFGHVTAPTLVLHGRGDELIPPSRSAAFGAFSNVTRALIDGAGHGDIGNFADYRDAIENFLVTVPGR